MSLVSDVDELFNRHDHFQRLRQRQGHGELTTSTSKTALAVCGEMMPPIVRQQATRASNTSATTQALRLDRLHRDSRRYNARKLESRRVTPAPATTEDDQRSGSGGGDCSIRKVQFAREASTRKRNNIILKTRVIMERSSEENKENELASLIHNYIQLTASPFKKLGKSSGETSKRSRCSTITSRRAAPAAAVAGAPPLTYHSNAAKPFETAAAHGDKNDNDDTAQHRFAGGASVGASVGDRQRRRRGEDTTVGSAAMSSAYGTAVCEGTSLSANTSTASNADDERALDPLVDGLTLPETNNSRDMKIFKRVLRDPQLRQPFQNFLEQQFCAENLNFYVAVEQFREMHFNNEGKAIDRTNVAKRIYERHFAPNSVEPVNIDNSTSKRIRETIAEGKYPRSTFDLAQYQIFHLLKYDCWPRYLRAGGIQPDFTDEELAEDEVRQQHRLEITETFPEVPICSRENAESSAKISSQPSPSTKDGATCSSPSTEKKKLITDKDKRRLLLWHGIDRLSRKLRREPFRSSTGSPEPKHSVGSSGSGPTPADRQKSGKQRLNEPRRSYSQEMDDNGSGGGSLLMPSTSRVAGSAGTRRRQIFASNKQYSMPAEMVAGTSPSYARKPPQTRCEPKQCRLMTGDNFNTEVVELQDPTLSVRSWTQAMAAEMGMDRNSTEAVDAETGSTIDPARQAIDALQSRSVRLVPVVTFALEILPPNYSFKNPSTTPTKVLMVRARQSLSAGCVMRTLLGKYAIDFNAVVVVFGGTLDQIRSGVSIGNIGPKTLTVMSQQQFHERTHGGKKEVPPLKETIMNLPNLALEHNLQFHQHGDVSYCELPSEHDRAKHGQKGDHTLSWMKFVRKASAAVTSKEENAPKLVGQKSSGRRKSVSQSASPAGVYCGEDMSAPAEHQKENLKKRLSIFKNKSKDSSQERPASGSQGTPCCSKDRSARPESPPLELRTERNNFASSAPASQATSPREVVSEKTSNGDTPRTPAIFSSKICNEADNPVTTEHGWQPAAFV